MAKSKYVEVGSVVKGKDGKPDYIKIKEDVTLKAGTYLNLESKAVRLASINQAVKDKKMSQEMADKIREGIEKTPDFVRFRVTMKVEQD